MTHAKKNASGFTMVEMMVVIGVIIVLITILVPLVGKIEEKARATKTTAELASISAAIESYYNDYHAYPGPFSNDQVQANAITGAENLVAGLLGQRGAAGFTGPVDLTVGNPHQLRPYMTPDPADVSSGTFVNDGGYSAADTGRPEFLDRIEPRLPILYLRARVGATGVVALSNAPSVAQYDLAGSTVPYTAAGNCKVVPQAHGLTQVGALQTASAFWGTNAGRELQGFSYLVDPTQNTGQQATSAPRSKDRYILISAGLDHRYGTADDITSFGSVSE